MRQQMPSHAGRYNFRRMDRMREILDAFHSVLIVPIFGGDFANINLMGIKEDPDQEEDISFIKFARIGIAKAHNKNKALPHDDQNGVYCLRPFEEDILYGMAALLTSIGYDAYLPKLKRIEKEVTRSSSILGGSGWMRSVGTLNDVYHVVEFKLFVPRPDASEGHLVTIDNAHAMNYCNRHIQSDFKI